ncbi:MAG: SIR2 family protein [Planctomycetales bacterium]
MPRVFGRNLASVSSGDVIDYVNNSRGSFVLWLGAGASVEAGVKTGGQICEELSQILSAGARPGDLDAWRKTELNWNDGKRRYSTCLRRYAPTPAQRVQYFRKLIDGIQPSFSHHAAALLMGAGIVKQTCLTTNFDKLVEMAFAQQGFSEYQAIRSDEEAKFHRQLSDKCYVVKLHGDYDTHNILNTVDEIIRIPPALQEIAQTLLQQGGLVLVGSSGYEESVLRMLNDLLDENGGTYPNMGVYWGINVGSDVAPAMAEQKLHEKLVSGSVSVEAVELMDRANRGARPCAFFPIGGAGNFFFDLIRATGNRSVIGRSLRYLDHPMRLRRSFTEGGLSEEAVKKRLDQLNSANRRRTLDLQRRSENVRRIVSATEKGGVRSVQVLYGDITSRSLMGADEFSSARRAVVSPDDNFLSAGGGAALALLNKGGLHGLLHELSKFGKVAQREVVVTSGGDLPVHYLLHAATTQLKLDGTSTVMCEDVTQTLRTALVMATHLGVSVVFTPLIAAGTEAMPAIDSLTSVLLAMADFPQANVVGEFRLVIVIRDEATLARADVERCLEQTLGAEFEITH